MTRSKIHLALLLVLPFAGACHAEEQPAPKARQTEKLAFRRKEEPKPPPPITDPSGNLLPSGEKILWFELPKGFTQQDTGLTHLLTGKGVELDKLEEYVAARVLARKFDRSKGGGGAYVEARSPEDPRRPPLDVTISRGFRPGEVFLRVSEYQPANANPLPLDQARSALLQDQKHAE